MTAGLNFSVKGDVKAIIKDLNRIQKTIVPQVVSSTLNKTATKVRSVSTKHISRIKNIRPQKVVRTRFLIKKSNKHTQTARITALLADIPIDKLSNSKRHIPPGAFPIKTGGKDYIVQRKPTARSAGGKDSKGRRRRHRLPVKRSAIRISELTDATIRRHIRTTGGRFFVTTFERELQRRLQRKGLI